MGDEPNEKQPGDMILLWDWENTARGVRERGYTRHNYDLSAGFTGLRQWCESIGQLIRVFLFSPMHKLFGFDATFQMEEFSIILCPKILQTINSDTLYTNSVDTTDATLIKMGEFCLKYMPSIRYLCIGSGDKHFIPLLRSAKEKGIQIAVVYGNETSLASEVWDMADRHPETGLKMVHLFSPGKK